MTETFPIRLQRTFPSCSTPPTPISKTPHSPLTVSTNGANSDRLIPPSYRSSGALLDDATTATFSLKRIMKRRFMIMELEMSVATKAKQPGIPGKRKGHKGGGI